jgi:hypothetical protein
MAGYIYLVHTPEYSNANIPIYKLGRTMQEDLRRFKDYPEGSKLLLHKEVNDHVRIEAELIAKFNELFTLVDGREWFLGDRCQMEDTIDEHIRLTRSRLPTEVLPVKTNKKKVPKMAVADMPLAEPPKAGYTWLKTDKRMEDTINNLENMFGGMAVNDDDYVHWD